MPTPRLRGVEDRAGSRQQRERRKLPRFATPVGSVAFLKIICAAIIEASWRGWRERILIRVAAQVDDEDRSPISTDTV